MPNTHIKITKANVDEHCVAHPARAQVIFWDTDLKGFGLVVGKRTKTYIVQRDMPGQRTVRVSIGRHGTWTAELARREARSLMVKMDKGENPLDARKAAATRGITFRSGLTMHIARLRAKDGSEITVSGLESESERYLKDWLDRPLGEITRADCRQRHERITRVHGPYVANRALRGFRATYNTCLREHDLPTPNPCIAVNWNKERRRQEPIDWADMPQWFQRVQTIAPVRRDYNLLVLLTGLRATDAKTVRWEHVDFEAGTLFRPRPKGGSDRAFTIPLSAKCLSIMRQRKIDNLIEFGPYGGDAGWVFPTIVQRDGRNVVSHLSHPRETRNERAASDGKLHKVSFIPSPHRLRDTYTTACNEVGLSPFDLDVLTNHRPANGTVTAGYIKQSLGHLRLCQEKVSELLLGKMSPKPRLHAALGQILDGS